MAWKVRFQLLCSDIPNLNDCNKFTTKGYGYIHSWPGPAQGLGKLGLGLRPHPKKKIP